MLKYRIPKFFKLFKKILNMKKLTLFLLFTLITNFTFSQAFFNLMSFNFVNDAQNYRSITEETEDSSKCIFTVNVSYAIGGTQLVVRKFSSNGEFIDEINTVFSNRRPIVAKNSYFHNDTLYIIGSDNNNIFIYCVPDDMSSIDITNTNLKGNPLQVQFNDTSFKLLCYMNSFDKTEIYNFNYNLNISDSLIIEGLSPNSFYIDDDTTYISCHDTITYPYHTYHIKKIYGQVVEDIITFPTNIKYIYMTLCNDKRIAIKARNVTTKKILFEIYSNNGILLYSDSTDFNADNDYSVYPVNYLNKIVYTWYNDNKIKMKILSDDMSESYYEFSKPDTSFVSTSASYTTEDHIYIYGQWSDGYVVNPYILKTDEFGAMSQPLSIMEPIKYKNKFSFYPNPVIDNITLIRLTNDKLDKVYIYDISGRLIDEKIIGNSNQINLSYLKPALYLITMDKIQYIKLLKK